MNVENQTAARPSGKRGKKNDQPKTVEGTAIAVREEVMPPGAAQPPGTGVSVVETANPLQVLLTLLQDPNTDPDRILQMMKLQEMWEKSEARKAYDLAFAEFKKNPPVIIKDKQVKFDSKNGTTEYKHAELYQVTEKISAELSKHGLTHSWQTVQPDGGMVEVTCTLKHFQGHSESVTLKAGRDDSGGKNNIQALVSTVSYLERHTLLAVTGMATKSQDDDGRASTGVDSGDEKLSADQYQEIIELIKETNSDTGKFCEHFKVETVDEIPSRRFPDARALLVKKKEQQRKVAKGEAK